MISIEPFLSLMTFRAFDGRSRTGLCKLKLSNMLKDFVFFAKESSVVETLDAMEIGKSKRTIFADFLMNQFCEFGKPKKKTFEQMY